MPSSPSDTPRSNNEKPKDRSFRNAIFLVLASCLLSGDNKTDNRGLGSHIVDRIISSFESKIAKRKPKHKKIAKPELTDSMLLAKLRDKMKPLKLAVPQEVISAMNEYDPEKAKLLDSVMIVMDEDLGFGLEGQYMGRIKIGKSGRVLLHAQGEHHLVRLQPEQVASSSLKLAEVLVHEVYGHAYDSKDSHVGKSSIYEGSLQDKESLLKHVQLTLPFMLEDEFRAFHEEYRFLDWAIKSNNPLYEDYKKKEGGDKEIDFPLYEEYLKAQKNDDWTEFKSEVAASYIRSQKHLRLALHYCNETYNDNVEDITLKSDGKNKSKSSKFIRKFVNLILKEVRTEAIIRLCLEKDASDLTSPSNPNFIMPKSNRNITNKE